MLQTGYFTLLSVKKMFFDVETVRRGAVDWDGVREWAAQQRLRRHLLLPSAGEQHAGVLPSRQDRRRYALSQSIAFHID